MANSQLIRDNSGSGRPDLKGFELTKRRAPYALRACSACRRRKGRCDGRRPCGFCVARKQDCEFVGVGVVPPDGPVEPAYVGQACQLDRRSSFDASLRNSMTPNNVKRGSSVQTFCGPTSPEYSFNVAQIKMRRGSFPSDFTQTHSIAAILDEDLSGDDSEPGETNPLPASAGGSIRNSKNQFQLLQFRSIVSLEDATRLLSIYQEVIGDLHPIVDLDMLFQRARLWYADGVSTPPPSHEDEMWMHEYTEYNHLLIFNLVLSIALRAESTFSCSVQERKLQANFQSALSDKLFASAASIQDVTIVVLTGIYHFFQNSVRSSWRMCGIAGRMAMELGLHSTDVFKHKHQPGEQPKDTALLIGSILVLDRQWSASTGLPNNFGDSSFGALPKSLIQTPYLKAMLSFILFSDEFTVPISHASQGRPYEDTDTYDLLDFRIEQWRKKAVGNEALRHADSWRADPSTRPPAWTILLNLRAESVRSLLLRPFFFAGTAQELGRSQLTTTLNLVSRVVHSLFMLDINTDIFQKQYPYYAHVLASVLASFFLMISYIEDNRSLQIAGLPPGFTESVGQTFQMANSLTRKYARTSRASRRLCKRLCELHGTLEGLNLLSPGKDAEEKSSDVHQIQRSKTKPVDSIMSQDIPETKGKETSNQREQSSNGSLPPGHEWVHANYASTTQVNDFAFELSTGWTETLLFDWPGADGSSFAQSG